jgi:tagatose 1,6-diphosphate aldolase GatY/KbaY
VDGSRLSFEQNAAFVRPNRELAGLGVTIEAKLGSIAGDEDRASDLDPDTAGMTDPDVVAEFIDRARLARVREASRVPLMLHGAWGLPREDLARAGASGIGKVSVNTELRGVVLDVLEARLAGAREAGDDVAALAHVRAGATRQLTTSMSRLLAGDAAG